MNNNKIFIILGLLAAAGLGYYFLIHKKKDPMSESNQNDAWSVQDTAAYEGVKALLDAEDSGAGAWVNPLVLARYKSNPYKIGGKPSKTATFVELITQFNPNKDGKHSSGAGFKQLWSQSMVDAMFNDYYNPLKATGSSL